MAFVKKLKALFSKEAQMQNNVVEKLEKSRAPRVRLHSIHRLEFKGNEPSLRDSFVVHNISSTGIGLSVPEASVDLLNSMVQIAGELSIGEVSFSITLKIIRKNKSFIGASFENPSQAFTLAIKKYFDAEIAAIQLNAVRQELLKEDPDGVPHWYQGNNNCGLSFVSNGDEVLRFTMTIFGNYIEGGKSIPIYVGTVQNEESPEKARYKGSEILYRQQNIDKNLIDSSKRMILAIEVIEPAHRKALLSFLEEYQKQK